MNAKVFFERHTQVIRNTLAYSVNRDDDDVFTSFTKIIYHINQILTKIEQDFPEHFDFLNQSWKSIDDGVNKDKIILNTQEFEIQVIGFLNLVERTCQ